MDSQLGSFSLRLRRRLSRLRRRVLIHRRGLAFLLIAVSTFVGLRLVTTPPPAGVPVVVAVRDLPGGSIVGQDDVRTVGFANGTAPAGRVPQPVGAVLASGVRRGEPITDARLLSATLATPPAGLVAFPLRLQDAALATLLRPGDVVDLVATDPATGSTAVIATSVEILAIPDTPSPVMIEASGRGALVIIGIRENAVETVAKSSARDFIVPVFSR